GSELLLTDDQRVELRAIAQSRCLPAGYVFRAKLILLLAEGASFSTIKQRLQTTAPTIIRWKQRFLQDGLDGLDTFHPGQTAMPRYSASMKKQPFKRWIVWTRSCRSRRDAPSATVLSITAMAHFRQVTGKTAARHTSCDFIGFLREVISSCLSGQQIHIILDNLSAHKTHAVREFLEQNPRVRF